MMVMVEILRDPGLLLLRGLLALWRYLLRSFDDDCGVLVARRERTRCVDQLLCRHCCVRCNEYWLKYLLHNYIFGIIYIYNLCSCLSSSRKNSLINSYANFLYKYIPILLFVYFGRLHHIIETRGLSKSDAKLGGFVCFENWIAIQSLESHA